MKILTNTDFTKKELQNAVVQNLSSAPGSPIDGQMYYDTTLDQFGVYQNGVWAYLSAGGGSSIYTADGALTGNRVIDLDGKKLQFYDVGLDFLVLDPANDESTIKANDGTANSYIRVRGAVASALFTLTAYNGTNSVQIEGDAGAETILLDAPSGIILSQEAGNGVGVVAIDNDGKLSWSAGQVNNPLMVQIFS